MCQNSSCGGFFFKGGNPRIYADYNNELIQMSEDHSVIAQLLKEGKITLDEAKVSSTKKYINKCLRRMACFPY